MGEIGYEAFFELAERPFSLTPDPRYFFQGPSHGRALESLTFGVRRRDPFLLVTGDLGVGKTTICRTLADQLRQRSQVLYLASPLLSAADLERTILEAFSVRSPEDIADMSVVIIDEAHVTPHAVVEALKRLSAALVARGKVMPVVFASQPSEHNVTTRSMLTLEAQIGTRARLSALGPNDCAAYVAHRLTQAGGVGISFAPRANEVLFALSGGVPRLVNLLCDRALREAAAMRSSRIEPVFLETAASAFELLKARPKRFRWFDRSARAALVSSVSRAG